MDPVKVPVVHFDTERIPIEIWNGIFKYNETEDLLDLSLVCKKFYETIKKTPETIDKIVLELIYDFDPEDSLILSRNYTNIKLVEFSDAQQYLNVFQKFGPTMKHLVMDSCNIETDQILGILELVQSTLKTLKILNWYRSSNQDNSSSKTFKLSKLEKLTITQNCEEENTLILVDFLPNTLTEINIHIGESTVNETHLNFLQNQKNLTHLSLSKCKNWDIFKMIDDKKVEFKLKSLTIISKNSSSGCKHFYKFLKSQAESLVALRLEDISLIRTYGVFENMPKLRELEIVSKSELQCKKEPRLSLPSLKKLKVDFHEDSCSEFFERFYNLQEIFFKMENGYEYLYNVAENHPNLKKLVLKYFNDYSFDSISLKSVLELVVIGKNSFENVGNRLRKAEDIVMEKTVYAMMNLKVIKLRKRVLLSSTTLLWVLVNCKKLKHLEIDNGSELSHTFLYKNVKLFRNLKFLKIGMLEEPLKKFEEKLQAQFPNLKYSSSEIEIDYFGDGDDDNNENDTDNFQDYD